MSWRDGVVYQIYPRSFCDSNGDGVGDLPGIRSKLDHLEYLGVDAVWLSPIFPSPMADYGYDVADYRGVDPVFGTLDDFDALVGRPPRPRHPAAARLRPVPHLDRAPVVHASTPTGTSGPTGATAARRTTGCRRSAARRGPTHEGRGRWYLHSFYPEQPDLDWRNPEVVEAMQDVLRFWIERGVDGFRIDAIDRLMKDPELRDDPPRDGAVRPSRSIPRRRSSTLTNSRNGPGTGEALAKIREAVGPDAFLVGEIYLPSDAGRARTSTTSTASSRSSCSSPAGPGGDRARRSATARREGTGPAWVMSNHDFGWLASRVGPEHAEEALELLLACREPSSSTRATSSGCRTGPTPGGDRYGRDAYRTPLDWRAARPMVEQDARADRARGTS